MESEIKMYDVEKIKKKYKLSVEEFEEVYNNVKKATLREIKKPVGTPIAIMTGGQPGAGKTSSLVIEACKEYQNLVVLDMDHYRGFFKKAIEIAENYPELYQEITGIYSSKILERLSQEVIEDGYNFILEGTMGKSVYTIDLLQQKQSNYRIIGKILAVSREESLFSVFERYLEMKQSMGIGRLSDIDSHDIRYNNLPIIAGSLENRGIKVEVYERSGTVAKVNRLYKTGNSNNECRSVQEAIDKGRTRSRNHWKRNAEERFRSIKSKMEILENNPKILQQIHILEKITREELSKEDNER